MSGIRIGLGAVALALGFAGAAQAGWQDVASRHDIERLGKLEEARSMAGAGGRDTRPISERELAGNWRCRTVKSGGPMPAISYSWFHCRISDRDGHLFFQKLSGSQRVAGYLYPHESGGFVLLGGWSVKGEPMHAYSGNGATAGAQGTPDDAVGLLSGSGDGVRIEFPFPGPESTYDVMELRR